MRKGVFWTGWILMFLAPLAALAEVVIIQDIPALTVWKAAIPVLAFFLIILGRNRDDVLKHHLA